MSRTAFALSGAANGFGKLAASLMPNLQAEKSAYDDTMLAQTKMGTMLAQMKAQQASADKDTAETEILTRRPGMYEEQVALSSGVDVPMVQAIRKMAMGSPETQMGPPTSDGQMGRVGLPIDADRQTKVSQALQRLAPLLYNKGDITPDNLAQASGSYAKQDRDAQGFAGVIPAAQLEAYRQYKMADGGKDRYSMGSEGRLDQFGGSVDVSAPTTQANIQLRGAQTGAQRANAAQSYASADSSKATAAKTRMEAEQGAKGIYDPQRGLMINPRTGQAMPVVGQDGQALESFAGGGIGEPSRAPVLGVPVPTVVPWQNQTNPKDANKVKLAEINRGAKEIEKDSDAARAALQAVADAKRFQQLNAKESTGGITDKFALGRAAGSLGADYSEMESITARLSPQNRVAGSGATSDFDAKQLERATVSVDKPKKTNDAIAAGLIGRSEMIADYADFRQTYLEQNGTLTGSERFWKAYANANPIFNPARPDTYELNPNRKDWRTHFSGGSALLAATPQQPAAQPPSAAPVNRNVRVNF